MKKFKSKAILTTVVTLLIVLFSSSLVRAAEENKLIFNGVWQSSRSLAVDYARGNLDKWFKLNPYETINKYLSYQTSSDEAIDLNRPGIEEVAGSNASVCIQDHRVPENEDGNGYVIKNIVDIINDNGVPKVIVYKSDKNGKITSTTYSNTDNKATVWLELGNIATKAYEDKIVKTIGAKKALQYFIWTNDARLKDAGMDDGVGNGGTVNGIPADALEVIKEAEVYAESIRNLVLKDNTNKSEVGVVNTDKYTYVGPFNITYDKCKIESAILEETKTKAIGFATQSNLSAKTYNSDFSKLPSSSENFYIVFDGNNVDVVNKTIKLTTNKIKYNVVRIMLIDGKNKAQNFMIYGCKSEDKSWELKLPKVKFGSLTITKQDSVTGNRLKSIGFKVYSEEKGKWLKSSAPGDEDSNYGTESQATVFATDANGIFRLTKLPYGKYQLKEVSLGEHSDVYALPSSNIEVEIKGNTTKTVNNTPKYVALSGYVWLENFTGKTTDIDGKYSSGEKGVNGVTVRLKQGNNVIQTTTTKELGLYDINGGEYKFTKVDIDKLSEYYIEFEYDGIIYQSTKTGFESKASDKTSRTILDGNSKIVNATGTQAVSVTNGANEQYRVNYHNINAAEHISSIVTNTTTSSNYITVNNNNAYAKVQATTKDAGYNLNSNYTKGQTKTITNINLGIYEKTQADLALNQDLEKVKVGVNGYWHIYKYSTRQSVWDGSDWNIGVKFANKYRNNVYNRAIYKSDAEYRNNDTSKELQVYLTYKIALASSTYDAKVNTINYYYDNRYTLVGAGTGLDNQNNITGILKTTDVASNSNGYNKALITADSIKIGANNSSYIYVQFKLERMAVLEIINKRETLDVEAEINSYSMYKAGTDNTVAVVDKNSVPGNYKVGNSSTYENDNDNASALQLEFANAREITGTVFEDATQIKQDKTRDGNGIFDNGEKTLSGVAVELYNADGTIAKLFDGSKQEWIEAKTITDNNGNYTFAGFVPGEYMVKYIWGNEQYMVQNYKGTIYDSSRKQDDKLWYKVDSNIRKTDAIDDYNIRIAIDEQTNKITNDMLEKVKEAYKQDYTGNIINKMTSSTPVMNLNLEYDTIETDTTKPQMKFTINNIDFGVALRAKQKLDLSKHVSSFKITSATGTILADAIIDDNGNLSGKVLDHVTNIKASEDYLGHIKAEMSDELLQDSTLQITYKIKATNNGEKDYVSERYYKYGIAGGTEVTLTPSAIVDYLDANLQVENLEAQGWTKLTTQELETKTNLDYVMVGKANLNNYIILYNDSISKPLALGNSAEASINVAKLLTTTQDLTYENKAEVIQISKQGGSLLEKFPVAQAESAIVMQSTGEDRAILPIVIGMASCIVLAAGIVVIKKKVIDRK